MLGNFFLKLRQKPKHVRDNIAFVTSGVFTLAVFLVWLLNTPEQLLTEAEAPQSNQPFSTLINQIKEQVASVGEAVSEVTQEAAPSVDPIAPNTNEGQFVIPTATSFSEYQPQEVQIVTIPKATSTASGTESIQ